jgi:hypothetical protein
MISCGNFKKGIVPIIFHSKESLLDLDSVLKEKEMRKKSLVQEVQVFVYHYY